MMQTNFDHWETRDLILELSRRMAVLKGDWRAPVSSTDDDYAHALYNEIVRRNHAKAG